MANLSPGDYRETIPESPAKEQQPLKPADPSRVHIGWNIKGDPVYLDDEPTALAKEIALKYFSDHVMDREICEVAIAEAISRLASPVTPAKEQPGQWIPVGWIQEHKDGRKSFYAGDIDPREIHDNGMPTYQVYRLPPPPERP